MSDYSLNETASRAKLAARGAGYSWGMSEEVSSSIFWLVSHGLPGPELLVQLLSQFPTVESINEAVPKITHDQFTPSNQWLCPLSAGCALSDKYNRWHDNLNVGLSEIKYPLLLLPFVADIAKRSNTTLTLQLDTLFVATNGNHVQYSDATILSVTHAKTAVCRVAMGAECTLISADTDDMVKRVDITDDDWKCLGDYAHRTYAPATDASRVSGAGAGLNDND